MTKSIPTFAAAFLMTVITTPVFAQAAIQEPGAYSFYHPNADVLGGRQNIDRSTNPMLSTIPMLTTTKSRRHPNCAVAKVDQDVIAARNSVSGSPGERSAAELGAPT